MTTPIPRFLSEHIGLYQCPSCTRDLQIAGETLSCTGCGQVFPITNGIPQLFWPDDKELEAGSDITETVKAFYEETPFPDYDDFDDLASLARKASEATFPRQLDEQIPAGARIIECGCGTAQLSNFLSIGSRTVFGADMCMNSLGLGKAFADTHGLSRVHFNQMNLFKPCFKPETFDLVISNGVLMVTADPYAAFESIARLVKPGGYILIGLYHTYGRLITDARRQLFRLTGDRFLFLDPNLRNPKLSDAKKRAWFADQYKHPHERKYTIGEGIKWLERGGFEFVKSIPRTKPFQPISLADNLFTPEQPGNFFQRMMVELGMTFRGSREGGFFVVIGRKP
jgi:SAM-dependent methyltransferase